jgi:hypothetical protein
MASAEGILVWRGRVPSRSGAVQYSKSERVEDNGGVVRVAPPPLAQLLAIYVVYLRRFIEFATIVRTRFFHAFHHT